MLRKSFHITLHQHMYDTIRQQSNFFLLIHFIVNRYAVSILSIIDKGLVSVSHIKPDNRKSRTDSLHQCQSKSFALRSRDIGIIRFVYIMHFHILVLFFNKLCK